MNINEYYGLPLLTYCVTELDRNLLVVGMQSVSTVEISKDVRNISVSNFGPEFFGKRLKFTETPPLSINRRMCILSTDSGAVKIDPDELKYVHTLSSPVITSLTAGEDLCYIYGEVPEVVALNPSQRTVKIEFSSLDYHNSYGINYWYRLKDDSDSWTPLGHKGYYIYQTFLTANMM